MKRPCCSIRFCRSHVVYHTPILCAAQGGFPRTWIKPLHSLCLILTPYSREKPDLRLLATHWRALSPWNSAGIFHPRRPGSWPSCRRSGPAGRPAGPGCRRQTAGWCRRYRSGTPQKKQPPGQITPGQLFRKIIHFFELICLSAGGRGAVTAAPVPARQNCPSALPCAEAPAPGGSFRSNSG